MAQKKFDPVTLIGLALAVLLFIGGQWYVTGQQRERQREWEAAQKKLAEERKREEAANPKPPVLTNTGEKPPPTGNGNGEKPTPVAVPGPAAEVEAPAAPDITVGTDELTLVFTAEGASLRKAVLNNAHVDTAKKDKKGLEILGEIEPRRLSFQIPHLEIGTPDPAKEGERLIFEGADGAQRSTAARNWKLESDSGSFDKDNIRKITYSLALNPKYTLTKTFSIYKERFYIGLDVSVVNNSDAPVSWSYTILGPAGILLDGPPDNPKSFNAAVLSQLAGRAASPAGRPPEYPEVINVDAASAAKGEKSYISREENVWGLLKNRFFTTMLVSLNPSQLNKLSAIEIKHRTESEDKRLIEPNIGVLGHRKLSGILEAGKTSASDSYALYMGPTNEEHLAQAELAMAPAQPLYLVEAVQYCDIAWGWGWRWPRVDWIAGRLMFVFHHLSRIFGNYGIAVILLTILIKFCLHPTQRKATISMNKMQKLQPEIKKLQDKYKGQTSNEAKMKMYQESQDLYKKAGASPASGCLPMLVQIPILSALYGIFSHAYEIRGAGFLWIHDLSQPDALAMLGFWPRQLNLLPLIYLGLQLLQMKVAPQAPKSDDPQQEMNRKMMSFMPIMFTFMFYWMPSGLMIYFATSAIFSIIEAWYIRKYLIKEPPAGGTGLATAAA